MLAPQLHSPCRGARETEGSRIPCRGALAAALLGSVCVHWPRAWLCLCAVASSLHSRRFGFPRGCSWRPRSPALGQQTLSAQGIQELVVGSSAHSGHWAGGQRPIYRQEIEASSCQGLEAGGWCRRLEAGAGSVRCSLLQVHYPTGLCPHLTAAFRTSPHSFRRLRVCRPG